METSAAGTAQDNRGRNSLQVLMLVAGWGAWSLWAVAYVGYLLVAVIPFSGNLVYCVAEDGSPSGSEVTLSLVPFGPRCADVSGATSGP